ncbi:MAG: TrkA family potassium uptake protein [Armatimonadetes bacterium]|nr:TrkA family potassium uptake protein [Armatimonadota bacterium]
MNVIILGCGRVGSTLARMMYGDNHHVTVIDMASEAFRRLGPRYKGDRVVGNGLDEDILRRAGIEKCDVFVSVTQGDNRNIMAAQIAKTVYNVPRVLTRINDPIRAHVYRSMGIVTICGTTILSGLMNAFLSSGQWPIEQDYNERYMESSI